jgi:hypothetical protein
MKNTLISQNDRSPRQKSDVKTRYDAPVLFQTSDFSPKSKYAVCLNRKQIPSSGPESPEEETPGALLSKWVRKYSLGSSSDDDLPQASQISFRLLGGSARQEQQGRREKRDLVVSSTQSVMKWRSSQPAARSGNSRTMGPEVGQEFSSYRETSRASSGNKSKYLEHWLSKMQVLVEKYIDVIVCDQGIVVVCQTCPGKYTYFQTRIVLVLRSNRPKKAGKLAITMM